MVVGVLVIGLYIPSGHSLKGKRRVLQALKMRIKNKFNVAIADVSEEMEQELWQKATFGIATVANEKRFANMLLTQVVNTIAHAPEVEIIRQEIQFV